MNLRAAIGLLVAGCWLSFVADRCEAQVYVVGSPAFGPAFGPGVGFAGGPTIVVQRPLVAPPVVVHSGYASGYTSGYGAYQPVVPSTYVAQAPVVAYRPVVPYTTYSVPYVAARPVVVHPKVYVPGQPVRNVVRAVTP